MTNVTYGQKPPTLQDLDQQLADLHQRELGNGGSTNAYDEYSRLLNQRNELARQQSAAQNPANPWDSVSGARGQAFGLANGRLSDLKGDPIDAQVIKELQNRISGKTNPYDATTRNAMLTQQAQMAAQAENQQLAQITSHGGSVNDPSYQSALREAEAGRQASAQQANLDINSKANLANYDAKTGAVAGLGSFNAQRNAGITNQNNYLSNMYGQIYANHETPPAQNTTPYSLPNFNTWSQAMQGPIGQNTQAPAAPAMSAQPVAAASPYAPSSPASTSSGQSGSLFPATTGWPGVPYPSSTTTQQPNYDLGGQIVQNALSGTPMNFPSMGTAYQPKAPMGTQTMKPLSPTDAYRVY